MYKNNNKNKILAIIISSLITLTGCSKLNSTIEKKETVKIPKETTQISTQETTSEVKEITENELNEDELVKALEDQETLIMDEAVNGTKEGLKEKLDEYFTKTIGFLFCDQPIKGKTLNDLSDDAKTKIVSITNNINDIIENYIPDYKIKIKEDFTEVKEWTLEKFKSASDKIKEKLETKLGEEKYNKLIETYESTKTKVKDITSNAIEKAGDLIENGKEKIKEWWTNKTK